MTLYVPSDESSWLSPFASRLAEWSNASSVGTSSGPGKTVQFLPGLADRFAGLAIGAIAIIDPSWAAGSVQVLDVWLNLHMGTGSASIVRQLAGTALERPSIDSPASMIAEIRSILSLNVSETARALGVERPTVYAWLSERARPHRDHAVRLRRMASIASRWSSLSGSPLGSLVRAPDTQGVSLVDMLASEPLPEERIEARLQEALRHQSGARATERPPSARETAQRHGLPVLPARNAQREIDWLTRRSLGPED